MRFFYCFFTLTGLLASTNAIRPRFYDGLQQVIGKETMTVTETITSTLYQTVTESATSVTAGPPLQHFRATITLTHTHTATASPTAEKVVQTWYGGQKKYGCDKTACASCRWYYNCEGGEPACFQCDTSPYCECGEFAPATTQSVSSRRTCSLGPGRTVPCDEVDEDTFVFGDEEED
ncbi:hypothetical protein KC318_g2417 [Hortaea werneckii]|uniref:Uncharacterized protein n=2 Tax=Hortaea werneckii TaxID=91943 RepID=A0A3M7BN38_HORWE|nr:hypothetical protein KC334_g10609 [Hortaea werneckii]KAI6979073.1 hypothetical protein KC355_g11146 [Hortaea werneckii]KAI7673115.1 hypothetical protein KC318_g2417 [Hortaea werneckii]RMY41026.1 hypothetical protein D0866_00875 [Hortaea werneckii]